MFWDVCQHCPPHPGVVPLGFELRDLLLLLQQLLPAGVQLLGQRGKLLSSKNKKGREYGSESRSASHNGTQQRSMMMQCNTKQHSQTAAGYKHGVIKLIIKKKKLVQMMQIQALRFEKHKKPLIHRAKNTSIVSKTIQRIEQSCCCPGQHWQDNRTILAYWLTVTLYYIKTSHSYTFW